MVNLFSILKKLVQTMKKITDPTKLHKLGWNHKIEFSEGVLSFYNYYLKIQLFLKSN